MPVELSTANIAADWKSNHASGRFYPQGFFHGCHGIVRESLDPARITVLFGEEMHVDLNHPLAKFPLQLQCRLDHVLAGEDRRGGRCVSPLDDLLRYPGLTAPLADGTPTDLETWQGYVAHGRSG